MRLQSLEIKGFKSFAKDTVIHFNDNVTGIVGPNGSGKSNIIDAIRWVLGEQKSKELRLEKMQDVIFNGTKKRKKAPTAEVSISFENTKNILPSEYHIVKVSRTLYRSGESEYRLNDVPCRLKDIKNLLVDTGIGSNSYAIIELGMVDDILQDKDHARRKMFEQAAGISKYKTRKREAISKLSLTQTDLDRVEDLLHEIEANLKSLEKQAKRARKYLDIKENYKNTSLLFHAIKINKLRDDYMAIEKDISKYNLRYHELRASINQLEASLQKEKLKNINDEKQLSLFQQKISSLTDTIRKNESRKDILENEAKFSVDKIKGLNHRAALLVEKILELQESITYNNDKIAIEQVEMADLDKHHEIKQADHKSLAEKYEQNKALVEQKEQVKVELDREKLQLEKEIAITNNKVQQAGHTIHFLKSKTETQKLKLDEEQLQLQHISTIIDKATTDLEILKTSEESKKEKLEGVRELIDKKSAENRLLQRQRDVKQNEIELLQSVINKLEGFPESIKFLHKEWKKKKVILSDMISCDDEHRAAVEIAMADYLDHFIVDTLDDAVEAISLLSTAKRGRARFFVLDRIPALETVEIAGLTTMSSLIHSDSKYNALIDYLMYETYFVSDNIKSTIEKYPSLSIVASDGSVVTRSGQITGGSASIFEGKKIGRKKKLQKLIVDKEKLDVLIIEISKEIAKLEDEKKALQVQDYRKEIQNLQNDLNSKTREQYKLQASLDNAADNLENNQRAIKEQHDQVKRNNESLLTAESQLKEVESKINLLLPQLSQTGFLNELTEQLSVLSREVNDAHIAKLKQENLIENLEKENKYNYEKLSENNAEQAAIEQGIKREKSREFTREQELRQIQKDLQKSYKEREEEKNDLGGIERDYFDAKQKINDQEEILRKYNKEFSELQSTINSKKDKASDVKFKIQGIKQRIQIEFSEDINKFEYDIPQDYSLDEQEIQIEKFQNRLANYGEVNPMAVEAYNEMEARKLSIETQRDDILDAKKQLIATMEEIESTATNLFLEAFEQARKHFVTVFRSLFTQDDDCDLILLDPENPLSSGIEIVAKPKGKRPQSLSQLSGGEKTLTASALLFSLYLLKPAPFCIFDEVDAPLDDQNVQKFTNIIRAFSEDSQFLVVTHNKATMAELDVLYGVYMEEKGVSSVSQVDFRNYDHNPVMAEAVG